MRSVHTTQFNHAPAQIFMNTGHQIVGRPSIGSWLTYGLGSENQDLPGFVVLISGENNPDGGKSCWGAGFLPTVYQGVEFRNAGDPVLFLTDPAGVTRDARRDSLDVLRDLNEQHLEEAGDPEILTRINSYELAYRMQSSVPELMEIAKEPAAIHALYGTEPGKVSLRQQLPAGPPPGRARRALRAALPPRLGQSRHGQGRRHREPAAQAVPGGRPGRRRPWSRT